YDSSIAGNPNTTYSFSGGIAAVARFNEFFQLDSGFLLERSRKSNGSLTEILYKHDVRMSANLNESMILSVGQATADRAFSYDYETTQFTLYDSQKTVYEFKTTYSF
ncbi:MAG TPA: hypothetical protein VE954_02795, partial [Oligoflexus sp.]|uniref:hypothetical protein n=1 Tax=Oligoflexus sp. TaxID=1971216 RepID=UPI002D547060